MSKLYLMKISFTDNITKKLYETLKPFLVKATEIRIGVAFAKYSGFSLIEEDLFSCLEKEGKIELMIGLDFRLTEPKVLRILHDIKGRHPNMTFLCFSESSLADTPVYHPKLYIINAQTEVAASVGSSNLTRGGLKTNAEANAIITANASEEIVSDIFGLYYSFKFMGNKFVPDLSYIDKYEEIYERVRKQTKLVYKEKAIVNKVEALKEKELLLPRPQPTGAELFGWQKLVFERLPEGVFKTASVYDYEKEFKQRYPENQHIRDKIRQILQQLRDVGLLEHLGKEGWRKK